MLCSISSPQNNKTHGEVAHQFFITICAACDSGGMEIIMLKKNLENSKNMDLCKGCNSCCNYVTVEIETPETKDDFDEIIWYINHKNIVVYLDVDDIWNIDFETPCIQMTEKGLCGIYNERPDICREYSQDECIRYGEGEISKVMFKTKEDVVDYVKKNTNIKNFK